jgi:hypothetical protein
MVRLAAFVTALVFAGLLAWQASRTPAPVAASAPATAFSAERAFTVVEAIAARPHPIGSPANAAVRDALVARLKALGLETRVQPGEAVAQAGGGDEPWAYAAKVENIIAVMPGRDRARPAVLVMAHYDSVPNSPGASDDAAGVASALETARVLKASGPLDRDVIFLLSDGEEAWLMGARAFFADDPLASHVGAVVNMDTRGDTGRAFMFETGDENGQTIARLQRAASNPSANALAVFIYKLLPNDTDFTLAKANHLAGLNFAFIGREVGYHTAASTPQRLNKGSLQHMGQQVLAAVKELSKTEPLPRTSPDATFSDVLGHGLIAYPAWGGWLALIAAALLAGFALLRARGTNELSSGSMIRGAGGAFALTLAVVPLANLVLKLTGAGLGLVEARPLLAQFPIFEAALATVALAVALATAFGLANGRGRFAFAGSALAAALACQIGGLDLLDLGCGVAAAVIGYLSFGRPARPWSGWFGFWVVALLIALALQILAPTTAFLFAWPLLASSLAAAAASLSRGARFDSLAGQIAAVAVAILVGAQIAYLAHMTIVGAGRLMPAVIAPFVFLAALAFFPLSLRAAQVRGAGRVAAATLVLGLGLALFFRLHPWASPETPRASEVLAVADLPRGKFYRVSLLPDPDPWTRSVLTADGGAIGKQKLPPLSADSILAAKAEPFASFGNFAVLFQNGEPRMVSLPELRDRSPRAPNEEPVANPRGLDFAGGSVVHVTGIDGGTPAIDWKHGVILMLAGQSIDGRGTFTEAQQIRLDLKSSAPVADVRLDGKPVALLTKPGRWSHLIFYAPRGGVMISLTPKGHGTLDARWATITPGWPADWKPLPPRPANLMPWSWSDSTVVLSQTKPGEAKF